MPSNATHIKGKYTNYSPAITYTTLTSSEKTLLGQDGE